MKHKKNVLADAYYEFGLASRRDEPGVFDRFHRHNEIELVWLERGSVTYLFSAGRVVVPAGRWAVFWGAMPHQIVAVEAGTIEHWLTVPLAWFLEWRLPAGLVDRLMAGAVVTPTDSAPMGSAGDGLRQIEQWHADLRSADQERRTVVLLEAESLLRRLALGLGELANAGEGSVTRALSPGMAAGGGLSAAGMRHVEVMAQYIARHYTAPMKVAAIAAAAGLHAEYATTIFRQACGRSLMQYVTEHRISHAQRLLATTDRKVLDIALASGFRTASRFYAAFEAGCGCAPKEYRKRNLHHHGAKAPS